MDFKLHTDRIKKFYFDELILNYPKSSHGIFERDFSKHLFEVLSILEVIYGNSKDEIRFLDVGAGAGINAIILKVLYNFDSHIIDRYDEFSDEFDRDIGNEKSITGILKSYGVKVFKRDFIKEGFPFAAESFDIVTSFDVIEHFDFSPAPFLTNLESLLKLNGALLIGTPNQVHFYNRIKSILGRNTWEDFEYFYKTHKFYGHVREFTPGELSEMMRRQSHLKLVSMKYSCYPFFDRILRIRNPLIRTFGRIGCFILKPVLKSIESLNYYMVAVSRKIA